MAIDAFVSVIMPIRNEARYIAASLGAVLRQDYPPDAMEILVADGASEDATRATIAALPGSERVRVIANPRHLQSAGMNVALAQARGDIIVRVDGHTVIAPDYVRQCVTALRATGAHNVGGALAPVGKTAQGHAIAAASRSRFAVPAAFHAQAAARFTDTVYMGAWPRTVLQRLNGFNERLSINEDYELNYRIRRAGGTIYLTPHIRSEYFGRQSLPDLAEQYFRYGVGKVSVLRTYPASVRPRQLVAPLFVAVLVIGFVFSLFQPIVRLVWLSVLLAYGVLNITFSLQTARRSGPQLIWRIPAVFAVMHVAWGAGFWCGWLPRGTRR